MSVKRASRRYWLTFDPETGKKPLLYLMSKKFDLEFNVRSASADRDVFVMALEFTGTIEKIKQVVSWFEKHGVQVEPVEINTIEG